MPNLLVDDLVVESNTHHQPENVKRDETSTKMLGHILILYIS